jgi:hypothetical protein
MPEKKVTPKKQATKTAKTSGKKEPATRVAKAAAVRQRRV